jgi:hypothetical protein
MRYGLSGGLVVALLTLVVGGLNSQEKDSSDKAKAKLTFLTEKEAGPDFAIQGEYVGEAETGGEKRTVGAQVIALGDGKFRIKFHVGGLPGDGWDGRTVRIAHAKTENGKTVLYGKLTDPDGTAPEKDIDGSISDGVLIGKSENDTGRFKRVLRKSSAEGAKAPADAIVLFDGSNADQWDGGKLVEGNLLNNGIYSKRKFKDFKAHVEFRLPFMPYARGQERANSGVYPQGHNYEVQILDSFGLDGKDNECGALYTVRPPDVNMCYPPLSWQTYDIDFKAARFDASGKKMSNAVITVVHNGVTVHNKAEMPVCTEDHDRPIQPGPGLIHLQNHGNPVYFRNIWVVETK